MRESTDPGLSRRLVEFVNALMDGRTLDQAAKHARLDRSVGRRLLESVAAQVKVRSGHTREKTAVAGPKGGAGRVGPLTAYTDGASRGNPGQAACAVVLFDDAGEELLRRAKRIGVTTNNVAEYEGVLLALELAGMLRATDVLIKLDSELVVKQLNGQYKVKHPTLKPLHERARVMMGDFRRVEVMHIPRGDNKIADKLANDELDGKA